VAQYLPPIPNAGITLLTPGQRLRFSAKVTQPVDQPSIDKVTAWQRGQLIFEDASLREAAQEFNRYGKRKLRIEGVAAQGFRVGGVFKTAISKLRACDGETPIRYASRKRPRPHPHRRCAAFGRVNRSPGDGSPE